LCKIFSTKRNSIYISDNEITSQEPLVSVSLKASGVIDLCNFLYIREASSSSGCIFLIFIFKGISFCTLAFYHGALYTAKKRKAAAWDTVHCTENKKAAVEKQENCCVTEYF
jgi:hypothetical protein